MSEEGCLEGIFREDLCGRILRGGREKQVIMYLVLQKEVVSIDVRHVRDFSVLKFGQTVNGLNFVGVFMPKQTPANENPAPTPKRKQYCITADIALIAL